MSWGTCAKQSVPPEITPIIHLQEEQDAEWEQKQPRAYASTEVCMMTSEACVLMMMFTKRKRQSKHQWPLGQLGMGCVMSPICQWEGMGAGKPSDMKEFLQQESVGRWWRRSRWTESVSAGENKGQTHPGLCPSPGVQKSFPHWVLVTVQNFSH